jgi:3-oxoacyl-[acyl-carrier protein] reductase
MVAKAILVTGSSGAIGHAIVSRLREDSFYTIGMDQRPPDDLGPDIFICADVTDSEAHNLVRTSMPGDRLWGLVFCAGIYPIVSLDNYDEATWDDVFGVNVKSIFQMASGLRKEIAHGGRVVIISSAAAVVGSRDIGYSASKAAALGVMRSLAIELRSDEILVNAVNPGIIESPMSLRMSIDRRQEHVRRTLLGRAGVPSEIAAAVSYLVDPRTGYITGTSINVDGGL